MIDVVSKINDDLQPLEDDFDMMEDGYQAQIVTCVDIFLIITTL